MKKLLLFLLLIPALLFGQSSIPTNSRTTVAGTNSYTATYLGQASLLDGFKFYAQFTNANTTTSTLTLTMGGGSQGSKALVDAQGNAIASGDISAGEAGMVTYILASNHFRLEPGFTASASGWAQTGTTPLTGPVVIAGTSANTIKYSFPSLGESTTNGAGLWLQNSTAALIGTQQWSPSFTLEGQGFNNSASHSIKVRHYVAPFHSTVSNDDLFSYRVDYSQNAGSYQPLINLQGINLTTSENNSGNSIIGYGSANAITTAKGNTGFGIYVLMNMTTGIQNNAFGSKVFDHLTTGSQNTGFGQNVGSNLTTQSGNTLFGHEAGISMFGDNNTYIGYHAGQSSGTVASNTGSGNTAVGNGSMASTNFTTGFNNTALGDGALSVITTGAYNVALGKEAGSNLTDGNAVTLVGYQAGHAAISGSNYGCFFGYSAGFNSTGVDNVFIGGGAGYTNSTGHDNTYIGHNAGVSASTGSYNIVIGRTELQSNTADGQFAMAGALYGTNNTGVDGTLSTGQLGVYVKAPNSSWHVNGSFAVAYVAKTALYTLTASDYAVNVTSGTHTQTLPTAVGIAGRMYFITNSGAGTVTVGTTSSQTFANVVATPTTLTLATLTGVTVMSNGANWIKVSGF